jgi:hypothetical protein
MGLALERARVSDPRVAPLAEALVRLEERDGVTGACRTVHHAPDRSEGAPCGRHHVSKRSLVVRWLDGEDVPDLVPSQMDDDLRSRFDHDDRVSAFRWWVAAYYDAICDRDDLRLLTLHDVSTEQADLAWGLALTPESRWRSIAHRVSRRTSPAERDIGVEGEIVDKLIDFTPAQFTQLQHLEVVDTQRLWSSRPDGRAMFDLALAVREIAGDYTSRTRRLVITSLRWLALTSLAVMFALRDEGLVPVSGPTWAFAFILLAVLAAFPYSETAALVQMSPGRMRSTLRLRDRP